METLWLLAGAVVAVFFLRRMSDRTVEMPPGAARVEPETAAASVQAPGEDWDGEVHGEEFMVIQLEPGTWTVAVEIEDPLPKRFSVRPGGKVEGEGPTPEQGLAVIPLVREGAVGIDAGHGQQWVAAEFPAAGKPLERAKAERIAELLVRLREASK